MKVEQRVGELITRHAKLFNGYNESVIDFLKDIQEDVKDTLLTETDLDILKNKQNYYWEIDSIISALEVDKANYEMELTKLDKFKRNLF